MSEPAPSTPSTDEAPQLPRDRVAAAPLSECLRVARALAYNIETREEVFVEAGLTAKMRAEALHQARCLDRLTLFAGMVMSAAERDQDLRFRLARHSIKFGSAPAKRG